MINFLGVNFYVYGLIIGVSAVLAILLIQKRAAEVGIKEKVLWRSIGVTVVAGLLGARVWHVFTDYELYRDDPMGIFQVWRGGLSIIGAMVFGTLGLWWLARFGLKEKLSFFKTTDFFKITDVAVFGLPLAQAVGRLANYFNQELYGLPTRLPWGITIDLPSRIISVVNFSRFHPLFLYEAMATFSFGLWIWLTRKKIKLQPGTYTLGYVVYYSVIRLSLEFLRVDPRIFNRVFLVFAIILGLVLLVRNSGSDLKKLVIPGVYTMMMAVIFTGLAAEGRMAMSRGVANSTTLTEGRAVSLIRPSRDLDRQKIMLTIGAGQPLEVELVTAPESVELGLSGRTEIGSDGMLFWFESQQTRTFWMKQMQFDLDLVWMAAGRVVGVTRAVHPDPSVPLAELERYYSPQPVEMVLEVPAGLVAERGIAVGDEVVIVAMSSWYDD